MNDPGELEETESTSEENGTVVHQFRARTHGFHFGCVPAAFFSEKLPSENRARKSIWVRVDAFNNEALQSFSYTILGEDVTRYFGGLIGLTHGLCDPKGRSMTTIPTHAPYSTDLSESGLVCHTPGARRLSHFGGRLRRLLTSTCGSLATPPTETLCLRIRGISRRGGDCYRRGGGVPWRLADASFLVTHPGLRSKPVNVKWHRCVSVMAALLLAVTASAARADIVST